MAQSRLAVVVIGLVMVAGGVLFVLALSGAGEKYATLSNMGVAFKINRTAATKTAHTLRVPLCHLPGAARPADVRLVGVMRTPSGQVVAVLKPKLFEEGP